jgi:hypothetical protein
MCPWRSCADGGRIRKQQIVALCELIEMLDPAALAPVQKIAQPLGVRLHSFGVFEEGFLGKEFLNLIHDPLAIGIANHRDRYATAHSVQRSLPALHGFDRCLEIHSNGFVFHPVSQVERTRYIFLRAPPPPPQINRNVAPILALAHHPVQLHRQRHTSSAEPNTEVRRKYPEIRKLIFSARNYAVSGWK